jgi:acetyltransferase-like isoleucine patch superfamily enzyme
MRDKILKAIGNPVIAFKYGKSIIKGYWYKAKFKFLRKNVSIGKHFRVTKKLKIRGPGRVIIGDNVVINDGVTPYTYSKEATIRIGNSVFLNGTKFGCQKLISIADNCIIGDSSMADTDFHHVDPQKRHSLDAVAAEPIIIEENVWIPGAGIILKGVTIGKNSVIGAGAVVSKDIPENCLAAGNPARVVRKL